MRSEVYDFDERLERCRRVIAGYGRNGELALQFLDHLASLGLSTARIGKYAAHLLALLRVIDFDLREATRRDVERVVAWINRQPYREWTRHDKKLVLRKLIQYAKVGSCDRDAPMPPEVAWVKLTVKEKDGRVTPEALIGEGEFKAMVKAADNPRDKAMIHVLFEGALRPGELLSMRVGSVEFKSEYCLITVNGKTGIKRIPLVASMQPLLDWLRVHPRREDPDAPLWCSLATNYVGKALSYEHFRLIIKDIAQKAGLKKNVWPYLFRHTTLTKMAKTLTEAQLEKFAGWTHGSKMSARYVHFSAKDLEESILGIYGIRKDEGEAIAIKTVRCQTCGAINPVTSTLCSSCGSNLKQPDLYQAPRGEDGKVDLIKELEDLKMRVAMLEAKIRTQ